MPKLYLFIPVEIWGFVAEQSKLFHFLSQLYLVYHLLLFWIPPVNFIVIDAKPISAYIT